MIKPLVLVIDDEATIRRFLRTALTSQGYEVVLAATGAEGLAQARMRPPELVLLDLGLPDLDGLAVLKRLREWSDIPVLILSVRDGDEDKVAALDAGAEDYVTKPFSTAELLARLRAAQRKARPADEEPVVTFGALSVDLGARATSREPGG